VLFLRKGKEYQAFLSYPTRYGQQGWVNVSGDCYQGDPLQGIKRFVKIAGIPNLEKFFQETRKEGHRLWRYFIRKYRK